MNYIETLRARSMLHKTSSSPIVFAIAASFALICMTSTAHSQEAPTNPSADNHIDTLKACQALVSDAKRLKCYDTAVGRVVTANDEGKVRIVEEADVKKTQRRLFGFNLSDIGLFGNDGGKQKNLSLMESVITKVSVSDRSSTVFITIEDGGAVWRIPNASSRIMRAMPGDKIVFKKAALGSYFIRINGRTGVKGRRVK